MHLYICMIIHACIAIRIIEFLQKTIPNSAIPPPKMAPVETMSSDISATIEQYTTWPAPSEYGLQGCSLSCDGHSGCSEFGIIRVFRGDCRGIQFGKVLSSSRTEPSMEACSMTRVDSPKTHKRFSPATISVSFSWEAPARRDWALPAVLSLASASQGSRCHRLWLKWLVLLRCQSG